MAMAKEGVSREDAAKRIWMVDSKGLIVKGRGNLNHEKAEFAHEHPHLKTLEEVVETIKPTAIIGEITGNAGVAAIGGAFTEKIIKDMAAFNERPIIFALSNPTSKAECTAEQCYKLTEATYFHTHIAVDGRGIFASGSPFNKVTLADGRTFFPGQGNNAYVFPGVALGVIACGVRHISEDIFLTTAEAIADMVTEENLAEGRLYPPLSTIREVSFKIAVKVVNYAYKNNIASVYPEPKDKEAFVLSHIYSPDYDSFTLDTYSWPQEAINVQDLKKHWTQRNQTMSHVRQKHVYHVLHDGPRRMEGVREVVSQTHFPGIQHENIHASEHGLKHRVQLQGVPVAVVQAHLLIQGLEVGRPDHYQRLGRPAQQSQQRSPNVPEAPDVNLHGEGAEVGPDAEDHHGVGASGKAVQFIKNVAQLAGQDSGKADGRAVAAVL
ncbi:hypothetical protein CCH79_00002630 [Gambusia affinis]|uniref:Malic enzyme NAD-binding domain-containing protein n=1 Tax=Gambusia affinis TaxID=33528 RepID=A0A315W753_GAMAF|nr:hypothetical protein CCH79_00002630 [Gambusia affinis]